MQGGCSCSYAYGVLIDWLRGHVLTKMNINVIGHNPHDRPRGEIALQPPFSKSRFLFLPGATRIELLRTRFPGDVLEAVDYSGTSHLTISFLVFEPRDDFLFVLETTRFLRARILIATWNCPYGYKIS